MNRSVRLLGIALSVLSLSACGLPWEPEEDCSAVSCVPCPPALTLRITGASGQPTPEVVMGGTPGTCSRDVNVTVCSPSRNEPGRYEIDLQAPGYRPVHLVEVVSTAERTGCCSCGYVSRTVEVQLVPE